MQKPTKNDVAALLKKFADAGWIRESALRGPVGQLDLTPIGIERFESLLSAFAEIQGMDDGQLSALLGLLGQYHKRKHGLD